MTRATTGLPSLFKDSTVAKSHIVASVFLLRACFVLGTALLISIDFFCGSHGTSPVETKRSSGNMVLQCAWAYPSGSIRDHECVTCLGSAGGTLIRAT